MPLQKSEHHEVHLEDSRSAKAEKGRSAHGAVIGEGRQKVLTPRSETSTRKETRDDRIPHVLLLPPALHSTVERREHATPDTNVATCYRRASFDDRQRSHETIALRDRVKLGADE